MDDEPLYLDILVDAFSDYGFDLKTELDGKEAVCRAKEMQPDLILLDIMMPGLNGFEVCVQLKADPLSSHIPIIFLSGLTDIEQKLRAFQLGAVDYITKPFDCREVLARINIHLDHRQQCQQLRKRLEVYENVDWADSSLEYLQAKRAKNMLRVAQYLRQHLDANHCLDQLANFAATNRTTLNRDFHQVYGMSVFDWLKEQRLLQAAELLSTTKLSILDIAQHVGYACHASFSKAFHQRFNISPREYRAPHS